MEKTFQVVDLTEVATGKKRTEKTQYYCSCKNTRDFSSPRLTEVDDDGVCLLCGFYAIASRNPNGVAYNGCDSTSSNRKMDNSDNSLLRELRVKPKLPKVRKPAIKRDPTVPDKRIYCRKTRTVYKSITDAARKLGLERARISEVVNGNRSEYRGYTFKRVGWKGDA